MMLKLYLSGYNTNILNSIYYNDSTIYFLFSKELTMEFYLRKKNWSYSLAAPLNSGARLCIRALSDKQDSNLS